MHPSAPRPEGGFATRAVHAGLQVAAPNERPLAPAIWPAATWATDRSAELGALLEDTTPGYVYGRYDDPTNAALHATVASLHEAEAAWSFGSGTAAIAAALEVTRGDGRILATDRLYGGTWALLQRASARSGWPVDHVDVRDLDAVAAALTPDHTVLYVETIANPTTAVADIAGLAAVAAEAGVRLVVDNTFASPWLCRPLALGADLVVESATKHIGGHGDVVGGVVAGSADAIAEIREVAIEVGGILSPFAAWLVQRGVQTLPLRMDRACRNAAAVAAALEDAGEDVIHPSLASHPQHALAARQFGGRGGGAVIAFDAGSRARAEAFADGCAVFQRAVSLGTTVSLVLHAASTTHRQLDGAALDAAGIGAGTVRLAVGIEDPEDLVADVRRALVAAGPHPEEAT